ncbi:MAG TPA: 3-deoxy-D-manno-octulosonic acid transferase, partial [Massilia timonae]|nr:3-deoxy-D-manno-octulosonic acid transferase [Massilia timonae]
ERIRSLGAPNVEVTGSVKFDVTPPPAALEKGDWLRSRIRSGGPERPVFLCASTREGEEALILDAWRRMPDKPAGALLAIVPRHPQR